MDQRSTNGSLTTILTMNNTFTSCFAIRDSNVTLEGLTITQMNSNKLIHASYRSKGKKINIE